MIWNGTWYTGVFEVAYFEYSNYILRILIFEITDQISIVINRIVMGF